MKCPTCQSILTSNIQLKACPICGHGFSSLHQKPSFEGTWALICEENLKKNLSQKNFMEAWQWHQKNLNFNQNDPAVLREASLFLKRYPQFSFPSFPTSSVPKSVSQPLWIRLAWLAFQQRDAISGLQLYWLKNDEIRQEMINHFPLLKEEKQASFWGKDTLFIDDIPSDEQNEKMLSLLKCSLKKDFSKARYWFKDLQNIAENEDLILDSPQAIEILSGLSLELTQRQEALISAINQEDVTLVLENLYRPLTFHPISFDHLYHLSPKLEHFLKNHHEMWKQITLDLIGKDEALRGIHLALQTLQQSFDLAEYCEPLLNAQYIKAYLRPYSEIERSDFRWR